MSCPRCGQPPREPTVHRHAPRNHEQINEQEPDPALSDGISTASSSSSQTSDSSLQTPATTTEYQSKCNIEDHICASANESCAGRQTTWCRRGASSHDVPMQQVVNSNDVMWTSTSPEQAYTTDDILQRTEDLIHFLWDSCLESETHNAIAAAVLYAAANLARPYLPRSRCSQPPVTWR